MTLNVDDIVAHNDPFFAKRRFKVIKTYRNPLGVNCVTAHDVDHPLRVYNFNVKNLVLLKTTTAQSTVRKNTTNTHCVHCGQKTKPLFNTLRWCPDCEKDKKDDDDDLTLKLDDSGNLFCRHNVKHCIVCCKIDNCKVCANLAVDNYDLWSL